MAPSGARGLVLYLFFSVLRQLCFHQLAERQGAHVLPVQGKEDMFNCLEITRLACFPATALCIACGG